MKAPWLIFAVFLTLCFSAHGANYEWRHAANSSSLLPEVRDAQRVIGLVGELSSVLQAGDGNCGYWVNQLETWTDKHEGELKVLVPRAHEQVRFMGYYERVNMENALQPLLSGLEESYGACQSAPGAKNAMTEFDGILWADVTTVAM